MSNSTADEMNKDAAAPQDQPQDPTKTSAAVAAEPSARDNEDGINVLSEEQTAAAMAALQEASANFVHPNEIGTDAAAKDNKKRQAEAKDADNPVGKKARPSPVRVAWDDRIEQLLEYKRKHGDLLIPIRYKLNPSLGKFVHNTREQYKLFHKRTPEGYKKKCSLTAERIKQLDEIGFVWSTERAKKQDEDWNSRFEQLKEYQRKHGNCLVPHGYTEDPAFAEWIHRQRTTHAAMQKEENQNPLFKERMDKLEEIGFNFTVHYDKWMDHWLMLKDYKEKHGHCQVPTHYSENPKLGRWVHTQRHQRRLQLRGKKSCMTQARIDLLNQLEFSWEVRPSLERPRATWTQRYEELKDFCEEHNHFLIPIETQPHLHAWCLEQKQRLKNIEKNNGKDVSKRMGPDRVKALHEIGFTKDVDLGVGEKVMTSPSHMDQTIDEVVDAATQSCVDDSNEHPKEPTIV